MIDLETMSILVVDDLKSMRLTIRKMLRNLEIGKMLRFAENGKEGLDILNNTPCDLVLIDWNMPVMNGTQMLDHIKKNKALRDLPVIMVTAENERDIVLEVAETEIDAYLLKPLTLESLDRKIRSVVENANNPDKASLHLLKVRELEEAGDYVGAIEQARLALIYKPSASKILRKLGLLHFKIDKPGIGEKCLQKAMSVNRQDTITRDHLARHYLEKREYEKAARVYLEILSLSRKYFAKAMDLGEKLIMCGYKSQAIEIFSKVIAKSRRNNALKEKVIDICLENKEYDYPKKLLTLFIQENPSNDDLLYKAGLVFQDIGDFDKALEYFQRVDSLKKGHVQAKLQIARIYYINRKIFKADDYLNQILRIDPKNQEAIDLRRQL
jgi:CheY-like chemotaxis protein/Tfp pilus assembly protein PilF